MAKVKSWIFTETRKSVKADLTFRTYNRNKTMFFQSKPIPSYKRTTAQDKVRRAYTRLSYLWRNAEWIDRKAYKKLSNMYKISQWNAFLKTHMPTMSKDPTIYFGYDEGTGLTLHDYTKNAYHAVFEGGVWEQIETGKWIMSYDGVDDGGYIPNTASLIADEFTLVVWVRVPEDSIGDLKDIIDKRDDAFVYGGKGFTLRFRADYDYVEFGVGNGTTTIIKRTLTPYREDFFCIGASQSPNAFKIYINDELRVKVEPSISGIQSTTDIHIAKIAYALAERLRADIGLIAIFLRQIEDEEYFKIYEKTKGVFGL